MIAIDVGGTFTDVVSLRDGRIETAKISTDYDDVTKPILAGARALNVADAKAFNHASTHGLNAVITRRLPKIGFLTTEGHRDILDMGRVWRPASAILDPRWRRSFGDATRPLVPRYLRRGIRERMLADGTVLFPLDEAQAREELEVLKRCGVTGVSICLLNSYLNPAHELRLKALVHEVLGDVACSISSEVSPLAREYPRASTTVIDTFMKIIYADYAGRLESGLKAAGFTGELNFADCAATLVPVRRAMEQPYRIVFSGPSAGAIGSAYFGAMIGEPNLLCADVGGTSLDISVVTGGAPFVNTSFELEHDMVVNSLAIDVTAIGAGGGSIVAIGPAGEIQVGPASAGSTPGPACYGRGGTQPTTTDTFLMIGVIDEHGFANGAIRLDRTLSRQAFDALDSNFTLAQRVRYAYEIAIHNIAEGLLNVAIKNGIDPRDYSLMAYGAAGPMLLPGVLDTLKCKQVIVPPNPGLFSALGLLSADQVFSASRSLYAMLSADLAPRIDALYASMEAQLREGLDADAKVAFERSFDARLAGQSWETPFVPAPDGTIDAAAIDTMIAAFHRSYEKRSGNRFDAFPVQGVTFRVRAVLETPKVAYPELPARGDEPLLPVAHVTLRYLGDLSDASGEGRQEAAVYRRDALRRGDVIHGPAVVNEGLSTTHVGARQTATVGRFGEMLIRNEE
ncbi:hydantoinase [Burkholderia lata]|uniref:hydantoinase/oxoprolinase family protein n=1 Tax=Burkholderia lata (strain ATCC 17760 / DSM 23089 / LMG 22485 / NCIMB 9086 / R18194 / 383) TaxID=482957 RepID=UPI00145486E5|nr:hydantoinase/oxoprolinase family protein [Burkholderia lata]VWB13937.1 hydantoinase [Burkholderia lata]